MSGDSDLLQVASSSATVLFVGRRQRDHVRYDPAGVEARYGVPMERIPALRALVGDPSDNLPGLAGVGPKTAAKWVLAHGGIAEIIANADALGRHAETVRLHAEALLTWEDAIRLRDSLDLAEPFAASPDLEGLDRFFAALEFSSLRKRLSAL